MKPLTMDPKLESALRTRWIVYTKPNSICHDGCCQSANDLFAEIDALRSAYADAVRALAHLQSRFGIAQPDMGGKYRFGGFNPGGNCGRSMEQDHTETLDVLATPAARSVLEQEGK